MGNATNRIHGLCCEHSGDIVKDFNGIENADYALTRLQEGTAHLSTEVSMEHQQPSMIANYHL